MKISAGIARRVCPFATSDTCIYVFIHQETVATQKHSNASINVNKTKATTKSVISK